MKISIVVVGSPSVRTLTSTVFNAALSLDVRETSRRTEASLAGA
jgi:hypothetical protein